jgi:glucans biosynthesis protein
LVQVETAARSAKVVRKLVVPNLAIKGMRTMFDVEFEKDRVGIVQATLRSGGKLLTETWSYAWRFYDL